MPVQRSATTGWEGRVGHGSPGTTPQSGAAGPVDASRASRTARSAGTTSPEGLLAAPRGNVEISVEASHES
jgi:hypothetical protein